MAGDGNGSNRIVAYALLGALGISGAGAGGATWLNRGPDERLVNSLVDQQQQLARETARIRIVLDRLERRIFNLEQGRW